MVNDDRLIEEIISTYLYITGGGDLKYIPGTGIIIEIIKINKNVHFHHVCHPADALAHVKERGYLKYTHFLLEDMYSKCPGCGEVFSEKTVNFMKLLKFCR